MERLRYSLFIQSDSDGIMHEYGKCYEMLHSIDYKDVILIVPNTFNYEFKNNEVYTILKQDKFSDVKFKNLLYLESKENLLEKENVIEIKFLIYDKGNK